MFKRTGLAAAISVLAVGAAYGQTPPTEQSTTLALIRLLVQEGILSRDKAQALLTQAEQEARAAEASRAASGQAVSPGTPPGTVRVPYVPEVVRNQIRDEVKQEVLAQAKTERWGDPGTLPAWLDKVKLYGDVRVRGRADYYDPNNAEFLDFQELNNDGYGTPLDDAVAFPPLLDTRDDRYRGQVRARLGVEADLGAGFSTDIRLAAGNDLDPVSTNADMATALGNKNFNLDRAYIRYEGDPLGTGGRLKVDAGRFGNPFYSTDLVWDEDVNFDGFALGYRQPVLDQLDAWAAVGLFPLQEFAFSSRDQVLYGGQIGVDWRPDEDTAVKLGVAYYDFNNMLGDPRAIDEDDHRRNLSVPAFMQKGNSLWDVGDKGNPAVDSDDLVAFGLASKFQELNVTASLDLSVFDPIHIVLTGDLVANLGYDKKAVTARVGEEGRKSGNMAYLARVLVGHPEIRHGNDWNASFTYKYLESDSVVDAFTDSDFHNGGTNAKGFILAGNYGVADDVWLGLRWLSSDAISGPKFSVDTLMLDINARF
ncbi:putative porin [Inquilinus limosus]|uniref:putative porin n=1 Tax=Inquilinus limosus TaxID=171674 RepID=UPI0003F8611A|nr:putative porin [Inquilinus limosus]